MFGFRTLVSRDLLGIVGVRVWGSRTCMHPAQAECVAETCIGRPLKQHIRSYTLTLVPCIRRYVAKCLSMCCWCWSSLLFCSWDHEIYWEYTAHTPWGVRHLGSVCRVPPRVINPTLSASCCPWHQACCVPVELLRRDTHIRLSFPGAPVAWLVGY